MEAIPSQFSKPEESLEFPKRTPFSVTGTCSGKHHGLRPWTHDASIGFIDVADEVMMEAEAKSVAGDVQGFHGKTGCSEDPHITVMAGTERFDF